MRKLVSDFGAETVCAAIPAALDNWRQEQAAFAAGKRHVQPDVGKALRLVCQTAGASKGAAGQAAGLEDKREARPRTKVFEQLREAAASGWLESEIEQMAWRVEHRACTLEAAMARVSTVRRRAQAPTG